MTDKEFKRLSRAQLIEIIYKLQLELDKLNEEKQMIEDQLADKRLRLQNAGNIADAALEMNDCLRNAQNAAEQYLNEIKAIREETEADRQRILAEAEEMRQKVYAQALEDRQQFLIRAQAEAEEIAKGAKKARNDLDSAIEAILQEHTQNHLDNG